MCHTLPQRPTACRTKRYSTPLLQSDEEEQYVLQAAEASSSDTSSSDSDSESTSEDSGAEDEDALALAYIGDDASGNPQLMTGDGSLFSVVQGEEEDGDGEQSLYLVETGHVEAASESEGACVCVLLSSVCSRAKAIL